MTQPPTLETLTQSRIHLIGGEKGGVGKSMVARLLAQYFIDHEMPFVGFDTDPTFFTTDQVDFGLGGGFERGGLGHGQVSGHWGDPYCARVVPPRRRSAPTARHAVSGRGRG